MVYTICAKDRPAIVKQTNNPLATLNLFHESHELEITNVATGEVMDRDTFMLNYYADQGDQEARDELSRIETRKQVELEVEKQMKSIDKVDDVKLDKVLTDTKVTKPKVKK